jgi:hypothetical protein
LCLVFEGGVALPAIQKSSRSFKRELFIQEGDDRIRTGDQGFADPCLTTWLRRQTSNRQVIGLPVSVQAGEEIRTLDLLLGKETFYH